MKTVLAGAAIVLAATVGAAQNRPPAQPGRDMGGGNCGANPYNCADTPNPIPAPNTVWLEEMTWMDVRDALKAGKTTIIIPTGGLEPNGPWLATGKHNYVLQANCEAIARKLGNALCAPIIKFVPEGNFDPPNRPHGEPEHGHAARGDVSRAADRRRSQLPDAWLQEHHS